MDKARRDCYRLIQVLMARGLCRHDGCQSPATVGHHMFKRNRLGTAFLPDAIVPLCEKHHRWAHAHPTDFEAMARKRMGSEHYDRIKALSLSVVRMRGDDFKRIRATLENGLNKYTRN